MKKQQSGFTLIELVVVIVILGILAAAAIPRFANLENEARGAALDGLAGALRSAASIAHATALAQNVASGGTVTLEGSIVQLVNSYPVANIAAAAPAAGGIYNAMADTTLTGFTQDATSAPGNVAASTIVFTNGGTTATCNVTYDAANANAAPVITVVKTNCS